MENTSPSAQIPPQPTWENPPQPVPPANPKSSMMMWGMLVLLLVVAGTAFFAGTRSPFYKSDADKMVPPMYSPQPSGEPDAGVACTLDAKICPDGSAVGRTGPNCEFAPCPGEGETSQQDTSNWVTVTSVANSYTLKIPPTWKVNKIENTSILAGQDYAVHMVLSSEKGGDGQVEFLNAITIPFAFEIKGPHKDTGKKYEQGLAGLYQQNPSTDMLKSIDQEYTQVGPYKALVVKIVNLENESELGNFAGEYCLGCTTKIVYVEPGNSDGRILEFSGTWEKNNPQFEPMFDAVVNTLVLK